MLHASGILQHLSFCDWSVSLNRNVSRFIHLRTFVNLENVFKVK